MKKYFGLICLALLFMSGCGAALQKTNEQMPSALTITDISKGLPVEGLWREKITLADINGDGSVEILAPPQRKAKAEERIPTIYIWDAQAVQWTKSQIKFPHLDVFDYGDVSAADIDKDGYVDLAFSNHGKGICVLLNDKAGGFIDSSFPMKDKFSSRTIVLSDINNDGYPDIVAFYDAPSQQTTIMNGILIGINKEGKGWEVHTLDKSAKLFGDSLAVADINGDGNADILLAPRTTKTEEKKLLWLGDGKGNFESENTNFIGDRVASIVKAADIDGDGKYEVVYKLSELGTKGKIFIATYKWSQNGMQEIASRLEFNSIPISFDLNDIDDDGRDELIVLTSDGLHVMKYAAEKKAWGEIKYYQIPSQDTVASSDLKVAKMKDGSRIIVYNLGAEMPGKTNGIKAFLLK